MNDFKDFYPDRVSGPDKVEHRNLAVLDLPTPQTRAEPVRRLEGLAVPWGTWTNVGGYMERFASTAFDDVIARQTALPLLAQHDSQSWPVGVAETWTAKPEGLHGVWRIDTTDEAGQEALRKVESGFVRGLSIGFIGDDASDEIEVDASGTIWVTRWSVRLLEVSIVSVPAYESAGITAVRSATTSRLAEWQTEARRLRRSR